MKKALPLTVMLAAILLLTACNTQKDEAGSAALVQSTEKAAAAKTAEGDPELMGYDFKQFKNVNITGIDLSSLGEEELAILYA